jgi:hypothetical protein
LAKKSRWAWHVADTREDTFYKILVEKPGRKRPLRRCRRIWEDDIKIYQKETGYENKDWIHLAQDVVQ